MKRRCTGTVALAAAASLLAATAARANEQVRFLLPTVKELPSFAPWILADYLGYYKQEGIDIEFLVGRGGVDVAKQVGAGNADMGEATGDTTIFVRGNGVPVKTVAVLGGGGLMQLVTREDAGINTLKDLRGKRVAVIAYADTTYYVLLGMLASVGLTKNDIKAEAVGFAGVTQMVSSGNMPAGACNPECVTTIEDKGTKVRVWPSSEYTPSMAQAIVASDKMIAERPEAVRKVVGATIRALKELWADPAGMTKVYIRAVPAHTGEEAFLTKSYENYVKWVYSGPQKKFGAMDPAQLNKLEDLYLSEEVIRAKVPVDQLYTNDFLP